MTPSAYDAWYDRPQGRWIGDTEYRLMLRELGLPAAGRLLDIGCGTGWFTRRLAQLPGLEVTGLDISGETLEFARSRDARSFYVQADAQALPFADGSFDYCFSVAALCFATDWKKAVVECVRVTRKRFAIGLLNRHSLHWLDKGRHGGSGAYSGALWLSPGEFRNGLQGLAITGVRLRSAIFVPSGSGWARMVERLLPSHLPLGALMVISGQPRPGS